MAEKYHLLDRYEKQLKRIKGELAVGIAVTLCIVAIIIAVGFGNIRDQAEHYVNDVRIDYSNLMESYVRVFDTVYGRIADKISEDPSFDEMDSWLKSQDESFKQTMGSGIYDGIAITYKGGYAHSWNYGDYTDYDVTTRRWYKVAQEADGKTALVPPYVTFLDSQFSNDDSYILMSIVKKYNDEISFDYDVKLTEINAMLQNREQIYTGTELLMYDSDGYILSCSDQKKFAHNVDKPDDAVSQSLSKALKSVKSKTDKLKLDIIDGSPTFMYMDYDSEGNAICVLIPIYQVLKRDFLAILVAMLALILFECYLFRRSRRSLTEFNNRDEQLSAITDAAFIGCLYVEVKKMVFYGSEMAEELFPDVSYPKLFAYLRERVFDEKDQKLLDEFASPQSLVNSGVQFNHLESKRFTMDWRQKDGTFKQTTMEISRIFSVFNGTETACLLIRDISEDAAILKSALKQAEKANEAKSEFLTRVSHDIRTPLNVIIGMTHLARDNENPEDTDQCIDNINVSSEFLLGLINDVLDLERIDSGKIQLNLAPYSGVEFTQYITAIIEPLCKQKNISFSYTINDSDKFVILQDKLRINQVYFNLLSNAVKFTPDGGSISFHTDVTRKDNKIILDVSITDTGIGMSEEFQSHMFESFTQESRTVSPFSTGTGLGLSIVKRLCDLMDMTISVKSQPEKGTTFFLHGQYEAVAEAPASTAESNMGSKLDCLAGKTILICDDHPVNREIACRLIAKKDARYLIAEDGRSGVDIFEKSAPGSIAAILMDIRMPIMDGLQATRKIRTLPRADARSVPIIALSANAYEEDVQKCIDAGMNAHLAKPYSPKELYKVLTEFMPYHPGEHQ